MRGLSQNYLTFFHICKRALQVMGVNSYPSRTPKMPQLLTRQTPWFVQNVYSFSEYFLLLLNLSIAKNEGKIRSTKLHQVLLKVRKELSGNF